jgi:hypothetical protein
MRTAGADSSAADGSRRCSTTRPGRFSTRSTSAPTRSCSAGGPTRIFAGSWGTGSWGANQGDNPISVALNTRPKYVASTTLTDPQWADTTVLSGDVAAALGELKAKPGGELQVHGSGTLVRWLFDNQLVDSRVTPSGVTIQVYRPTGRPQYATDTADL